MWFEIPVNDLSGRRTRDGSPVRLPVDGRDVASVIGSGRRPDRDDPEWLRAAEEYVRRFPRSGGRVAGDQRLALLQRLAAGPATTTELLAALRRAGWVGASDLANRLRELDPDDPRSAGRAVSARVELGPDGLHRLEEPFPALTAAQRRALGFARSLVVQSSSPLAGQAVETLDGLVPGLAAGERPDRGRRRLSTAHLHTFEQARVERRPVRVRYDSMHSGREQTYLLVPVTYVTAGPATKAVCVTVDEQGRRQSERQFALDRLRRAERTDLPPLPPEELELEQQEIDLEVTAALYRIMRDRDQFGIGEFQADETDVDVWRVRGRFPVALAWDVMEQLCAWAGSVTVHEPLWLVNAVVRRLRAGLTGLEDGTLELVLPEPRRQFRDRGEALYGTPGDGDEPPAGPRRLTPPA